MTPRERVLTTLAGGTPDCVPWFGDLDYWASGLIARGEVPQGFKSSDEYIGWHRRLGVGFYLQGCWPFRPVLEGGEEEHWEEGDWRFRELRTPRGTLRERGLWSPLTLSTAPVERLVKSVDDLRIYRWVAEHTRYEPDYDGARRRALQIGDQGFLLGFLRHSPLMQLVALDAGIECVALAAADDPEELDRTLEAVGESVEPAQRLAIDSPAEVLMISDNLSSEVVGERLFERYLRSYYRSWARRIREAGKYSCVHLDGTLRGLLRQVSGCGFTFIEAMTPAPVGDLPVSAWGEYRDGSDVVYWGGVPGAYFSPVTPQAEFERHVREVLSVMRRDRRYVLGVADQVPPDAPESRVRMVADLVEEHGRYENAIENNS